MAYTDKEKTKHFNAICNLIQKGKSLRQALKENKKPSYETFYKWLDEDKNKTKQYARATEERADKMFDDIISIADDDSKDQTPFVGVNYIHRDKLKIDARKWALAKMMPKKYGDKLELSAIIDDKRKNVDEIFPPETELDEQKD